MKRILFLDHVNRILGGAEVNLVELIEANRALPLWTAACACRRGGPLSKALEKTAVEQFDFGFADALNEMRVVGRRFSLFGALRGWLALGAARDSILDVARRFRPDIVVSCTNKDHFCAAPVCRKVGARSIWWVNDVLSRDFFPWPLRRYFRLLARKHADGLVAVSEYGRRALLAEGVPASLVVTIHNGIPVSKYQTQPRGALRHPLGLPATEPVIGMAGRLTPWKGQDQFLALAADWVGEGRPGHFVLLGQAFNEDQAYEQSLRDFVSQRGLSQRVHFVPFQGQIAAALSDLDVLVLLSKRPEPFGRVLIEAMSVGIPVMAARTGGVPEIISDGVDGLLLDHGSPETSAAALASLVNSPEMRQRLAENGRRKVQDRFSIQRVQAQFNDLFERQKRADTADSVGDPATRQPAD